MSEQFAELDIARFLSTKPLATLNTMIDRQLNAPLSSSCGHWFDAFAAMLAICPESIAYDRARQQYCLRLVQSHNSRNILRMHTRL